MMRGITRESCNPNIDETANGGEPRPVPVVMINEIWQKHLLESVGRFPRSHPLLPKIAQSGPVEEFDGRTLGTF